MMADPWTSLPNSIRQKGVGDTFQSVHLEDPPQEPVELGTGVRRREHGGALLFSDNPETLKGVTELHSGQTLATEGFNAVLFTDSRGPTNPAGGLQPNTRHRLFVHHLNETGASRSIHVRALNFGASDATLRYGPVFAAEPTGVAAAGLAAVERFLKAFPVQFTDPDHVPDVVAAPRTIPPIASSADPLVTLSSFTLKNHRCLSAIVEMEALDPGIHLYITLGSPPLQAYRHNSRTAAQEPMHSRGTFPHRVVSRIHDEEFVVADGIETPGRFQLVTREGEAFPEDPADTAWAGVDRTLWDDEQPAPNTNGGNYGRTHFVSVSLRNTSAQARQVAVIACPRTVGPGMSFFGFARDVGANRTVRVPKVPEGVGSRGTIVSKDTVPANSAIRKRFVYSTAGGSAGRFSFWVVPL